MKTRRNYAIKKKKVNIRCAFSSILI